MSAGDSLKWNSEYMVNGVENALGHPVEMRKCEGCGTLSTKGRVDANEGQFFCVVCWLELNTPIKPVKVWWIDIFLIRYTFILKPYTIHKILTRKEVSANRKSEVFINGHCYICNKTYTNVPQWSVHKETTKHKEARKKLLAELVYSPLFLMLFYIFLFLNIHQT